MAVGAISKIPASACFPRPASFKSTLRGPASQVAMTTRREEHDTKAPREPGGAKRTRAGERTSDKGERAKEDKRCAADTLSHRSLLGIKLLSGHDYWIRLLMPNHTRDCRPLSAVTLEASMNLFSGQVTAHPEITLRATPRSSCCHRYNFRIVHDPTGISHCHKMVRMTEEIHEHS